MKRLASIVVILVAVALMTTACSKPVSTILPAPQATLGNGVVAVVAGKAITEQEFNQRLKVYELLYAQELGDAETKAMLLDRYVNETLLVTEANKRGLKNQSDVLTQQVVQFNAVLANKYGSADELAKQKKSRGASDDEIKRAMDTSMLIDQLSGQLSAGLKVTDDEVKTFYDQNAAQFTIQDEQIRARHILVKEELTAKDIVAQLKAGGDFAKLATASSLDQGSAVQGGDLGYFGKGRMVKPFEEAAFALRTINDISDPVKTDFGYHIIQLTGRRAAGQLPLTEVKDQIASQLKQDKSDGELDKLVTGLKSKANIQMVDFTKK